MNIVFDKYRNGNGDYVILIFIGWWVLVGGLINIYVVFTWCDNNNTNKYGIKKCGIGIGKFLV